MANVLIVDDDKNFLLSFVDGLMAQDDQFKVLTAENGKQALRVLKSNPIDLVITDLKMPVMDGFELLADMSRNHSRVPVIVITAFGTPEIEERIRALGGLQYLEKPLDFGLTLERIYEELEAKSGGFIRGVSLPSFLQLMEIEKKSCVLSIRSTGRNGMLFFSHGELIDAETESLQGEAAALDIVSWDEAEIEIVAKVKKREKKIDSNLNFIVMEAYRLKDEMNRKAEAIVSLPEDLDDLSVSYDEPVGEPLLLPVEDQVVEPAQPQPVNKPYKEMNMNVKKLNEAMEELKANVGPGLLSSSIVSSADGQMLVAFNGHAKTCALFTQMTNYLARALKESGLEELGKYYIIDMTNHRMGIVIPLGDFWWGLVTDSQKAQLGLLLNVAIPRAIDMFEEAIVG